MAYKKLNSEKAFIWRIVHTDNLPWIFDNGLHCGNSATKSEEWINLGNQEIIEQRGHQKIPIAPYGVLNDYVPFYFTPFSPMMYNIHTGRNVVRRKNADIAILVSSLRKIEKSGVRFIFSDRHANVALAQFFDNCEYLDRIDWALLQNRDFKRDYDDPEKVERYQAEALIHEHCPIELLTGVVCYNEDVKKNMPLQKNLWVVLGSGSAPMA